MKPFPRLLLAAMLLLPEAAFAHSFGRLYNLPVPFWMYAWGASAALVASFLVIAYFVGSPAPAVVRQERELLGAGQRLARSLPVLKGMSLSCLGLCIVTGLFGTRSPYGNFNMTFFWVIFVLGFTYVTALVGNLYALINPWQVLSEVIGRVWRTFGDGVWRYPRRLGYWPALLLYMAFVWIELFGFTNPHSLGLILAAYSGLNLLGVWSVGTRDWFRYGEFFGLLFSLVSLMAPVELTRRQGEGKQHQVFIKPPFLGAAAARTENPSMLVFLLFMLSSTAFDGLHGAEIWRRWFWLDLYHAVLQDWSWVGTNPLAAFPAMRKLYFVWQTCWLLILPLIYLAIYGFFVSLMRQVTGRVLSTRALAHSFAPTLLPIALVYNISHYYTLIETQGIKIVSLASDPFGWGWNLFGTAHWLQRTIIPDAGTVWHVQVGLIVLGHVVSVYLAHRVALSIFRSRRQALISQLPMLVLMVLFTTAGLWILSLPLSGPG